MTKVIHRVRAESVTVEGERVRFVAEVKVPYGRGAAVAWDSANPPAVDSLRFGAANREVAAKMESVAASLLRRA